ncbi:unnamed protein product [Gordionus sp. m RMFG-2023]
MDISEVGPHPFDTLSCLIMPEDDIKNQQNITLLNTNNIFSYNQSQINNSYLLNNQPLYNSPIFYNNQALNINNNCYLLGGDSVSLFNNNYIIDQNGNIILLPDAQLNSLNYSPINNTFNNWQNVNYGVKNQINHSSSYIYNSNQIRATDQNLYKSSQSVTFDAPKNQQSYKNMSCINLMEQNLTSISQKIPYHDVIQKSIGSPNTEIRQKNSVQKRSRFKNKWANQININKSLDIKRDIIGHKSIDCSVLTDELKALLAELYYLSSGTSAIFACSYDKSGEKPDAALVSFINEHFQDMATTLDGMNAKGPSLKKEVDLIIDYDDDNDAASNLEIMRGGESFGEELKSRKNRRDSTTILLADRDASQRQNFLHSFPTKISDSVSGSGRQRIRNRKYLLEECDITTIGRKKSTISGVKVRGGRRSLNNSSLSRDNVDWKSNTFHTNEVEDGERDDVLEKFDLDYLPLPSPPSSPIPLSLYEAWEDDITPDLYDKITNNDGEEFKTSKLDGGSIMGNKDDEEKKIRIIIEQEINAIKRTGDMVDRGLWTSDQEVTSFLPTYAFHQPLHSLISYNSENSGQNIINYNHQNAKENLQNRNSENLASQSQDKLNTSPQNFLKSQSRLQISDGLPTINNETEVDLNSSIVLDDSNNPDSDFISCQLNISDINQIMDLPSVDSSKPGEVKCHWLYLGEELKWLASDFAQEHRWKISAARKVSRFMQKYFEETLIRQQKLDQEEINKIRKIASRVSKFVSRFWRNIAKVAQAKAESISQTKYQRRLDKQLNAIVGETEKYSHAITKQFLHNTEDEMSLTVYKTPSSEHNAIKNVPCHSDSSLSNHSNRSTQEISPPPTPNLSFAQRHTPHVTQTQYRSHKQELFKTTMMPSKKNLSLTSKFITNQNDETVLRNGKIRKNILPQPLSTTNDHHEPKTFKSETGFERDKNISRLTRNSRIIKLENTEHIKFDQGAIPNGIYEEDLKLKDTHFVEQCENEAISKEGSQSNKQREMVKNEEINRTMRSTRGSKFGKGIADSENVRVLRNNKVVKVFIHSPSSSDYNEINIALTSHKEVAKMDEIDIQQNEELSPMVESKDMPSAKLSPYDQLQDDTKDDGTEEINDIAAQAQKFQPKGFTLETTEVKTPVPFLLKHTLREYQHIGLDWLVTMYEKKLNGILADEMGLGKTIQTISLLAHLACQKGIWGPHLVIVPTSVMLNWEMEFKKWCPGFKILTYYGSPKERKAKRKGWGKKSSHSNITCPNVIVTSYRLVLQDERCFRRKAWHYLILDEAQNIKNFKSQRWLTLLNFKSRARLLLTGTPIQNDLMELWSLMHFLMPHVFKEAGQFSDWFARPLGSYVVSGAEELPSRGDARDIMLGSLDDNYTSSTNKDQSIIDNSKQSLIINNNETSLLVGKLHKILRPFILRRLKKEVEKQMPPKLEHVIHCRLSTRQRYLYHDFVSRSATTAILKSGNFLGVVNVLMQLRKVCNHPDLFEPRPVLSSFFDSLHSVTLPYPLSSRLNYLPSAICDMLNDDDDEKYLINKKTILNSSYRSHNIERLEIPEIPSASNKDNIDLFLKNILKIRFNLNTTLIKSPSTILDSNNVAMPRNPGTPSHNYINSTYLTFFERISDIPPRLTSILSVVNIFPVFYKGRNLESILEILEPVLTRFLIFVPPTLSTPFYSYCSHPTPSSFTRDQSYENRVGTFLNTGIRCLPHIYHDVNIGRLLKFPEVRLIEYDCGKLQILKQLLSTLKAQKHRVLIFTQMTKVLDILESFLNYHGHRYLRLDGTTKIELRQILTDRFNSDSRIFCFILSTRSGGLGINLTGADTVIFYDSDWNPTMDAQAQDRCHRIGQTRPVHIYRLISQYTVEENILLKARQKKLLGDITIEEGNFTTAFFKQEGLKELFKNDSHNDSYSEAANAYSLGEKGLSYYDKDNEEQGPRSSDDGEVRKRNLFEEALAMTEDDVDSSATRVALKEKQEIIFQEAREFDEEPLQNELTANQRQEILETADVIKSLHKERIDLYSCELINKEETKEWKKYLSAELLTFINELRPIERLCLYLYESTNQGQLYEDIYLNNHSDEEIQENISDKPETLSIPSVDMNMGVDSLQQTYHSVTVYNSLNKNIVEKYLRDEDKIKDGEILDDSYDLEESSKEKRVQNMAGTGDGKPIANLEIDTSKSRSLRSKRNR